MISWKSQEKVLPIDTSHISRGYVEIEKKNKLKCEQIWR